MKWGYFTDKETNLGASMRLSAIQVKTFWSVQAAWCCIRAVYTPNRVKCDLNLWNWSLRSTRIPKRGALLFRHCSGDQKRCREGRETFCGGGRHRQLTSGHGVRRGNTTSIEVVEDVKEGATSNEGRFAKLPVSAAGSQAALNFVPQRLLEDVEKIRRLGQPTAACTRDGFY